MFDKSLRVLIPFHAGPDSFQDNVAYTLKKMGHEVITSSNIFKRDLNRFTRLAANFSRSVFPNIWQEHEKFALLAAREFKPNIVLCLTQTLRSEVMATLKKMGVNQCIAWWGDAPSNMRGMGLLEKGWDKIYIKDSASVKKLRLVGFNAELLHEAMNPDWHSYQGCEINKDLAVVGNYYGFRQYLVGCLLDAGVDMSLYGAPPPRWGDPRIKKIHTGRYITKAEKSAVFESALASLNSTSMTEGDSLNCRAFEICGAAGLQLIEEKDAIEECFEPGMEVLTYKSVDEILMYLERAQTDPAWARSIRMAGYKRARACHTYEQRLKSIVDNFRKN